MKDVRKTINVKANQKFYDQIKTASILDNCKNMSDFIFKCVNEKIRDLKMEYNTKDLVEFHNRILAERRSIDRSEYSFLEDADGVNEDEGSLPNI